jgi:hypothetical protein
VRDCRYEENRVFAKQAEIALRRLFSDAKVADELNFAASLSPEFRPYKLNSAVEAQYAFSEYSEFLAKSEGESIRPRVALAFYAHLAEASGFWEVVKNLLCVLDGRKFNFMPFSGFTKKYGAAAGSPVPNANKLMRSLISASGIAGRTDLELVFARAFDSDLRNAYAHADYVLRPEGVIVLPRYDHERLISWNELNELLERAVVLYLTLNDIRVEHCNDYLPGREVLGKLNRSSADEPWTVEYSSSRIVIACGARMLQFASYPNLPVLQRRVV